jgi:hypothetical protein
MEIEYLRKKAEMYRRWREDGCLQVPSEACCDAMTGTLHRALPVKIQNNAPLPASRVTMFPITTCSLLRDRCGDLRRRPNLTIDGSSMPLLQLLCCCRQGEMIHRASSRFQRGPLITRFSHSCHPSCEVGPMGVLLVLLASSTVLVLVLAS